MRSSATLHGNICSENDSCFPSESAEQEPAPSPALPSTLLKPCAKHLTDPHLPPPASMALGGSKTSSEHYKGQTFWVFCTSDVSLFNVMPNSPVTKQVFAVVSAVS